MNFFSFDFFFFFNVSFFIFCVGVLGIFLNRKNVIIMLMSLELILLAVNFLLIIGSIIIDDLVGQFLALLVLTVAASEASIGLALMVAYYRVNNNISLFSLNILYN